MNPSYEANQQVIKKMEWYSDLDNSNDPGDTKDLQSEDNLGEVAESFEGCCDDDILGQIFPRGQWSKKQVLSVFQ